MIEEDKGELLRRAVASYDRSEGGASGGSKRGKLPKPQIGNNIQTVGVGGIDQIIFNVQIGKRLDPASRR